MTNPSTSENQNTTSPTTSPAEIQKKVDNHTKIAAHLETAAKHHQEAAKNHQAGDIENADFNTATANEHHNKATEIQKEITATKNENKTS